MKKIKTRRQRNRERALKKGKPVSKEKYEELYAKEKETFEDEINKNPLSLTSSRLSRHKQVYTIFKGTMPTNAFQIKSFAKSTYNFIFDSKKQTLKYVNGPDKVECVVTDPNWGNLFSACEAIMDYDWTESNKKAKHILEIDTKRYLRMQLLAKWLIELLNQQQKQKEDKAKVDDKSENSESTSENTDKEIEKSENENN